MTYLKSDGAKPAFERVSEAAEVQGKSIYNELVQAHRERLAAERKKGEYAFAARRRAVERIGLPAVRSHRLTQLAQEERAWREQLNKRAEVGPDMVPLAVVRVMSHED